VMARGGALLAGFQKPLTRATPPPEDDPGPNCPRLPRHAVVVTDISDEAVWINDPVLDSGPMAISQGACFKVWAATGHTLIWISPC
jgi:hypothetical protein